MTCISATSGLFVPVMSQSWSSSCQWVVMLLEGVLLQEEQHCTKPCMHVIPPAPVLSMPKGPQVDGELFANKFVAEPQQQLMFVLSFFC